VLKRIAVILLLLLPAAAHAETRLALIVTNASYPNEIGKLANPHKDGDLIAAALNAVGFTYGNITVIRDADQTTMRLAMAEFIERIEKAGPDAVAFFYYSGHGAADRTDRGENYLIPVGAKISLAKQLPILGVSLREITKSLERVSAKARFVVIDACRNVGFTKGVKEAAKGFIPSPHLDGIIVAFATRPGDTAEDDNVYASALASILPTPGLEAQQVLKETQRKVADLSKSLQIPWTEDGLLTRFKFKEAALTGQPKPADATAPAPQLLQVTEAAREWARVDKTSAVDLETFLRRNGSSSEADYARARLGELKKQTASPAVVGDDTPAASQRIQNPKSQGRDAVVLDPPVPFRVIDSSSKQAMLQQQVDEKRRQPFGGADWEKAFLRPGQVFRDCSNTDCPEMMVVPAGSFMMGSNDGNVDEKPVHKVTIAKQFAVGKFAVTFAEWDACVAAGGCTHKPEDQGWGRGTRPVINVSWNDATSDYLPWLSRKTGKSYRLLTEAEWEYAARAGTTTTYSWGNDIGNVLQGQ
jgi:formylglycine-generating enzyme required for sulfatase activity